MYQYKIDRTPEINENPSLMHAVVVGGKYCVLRSVKTGEVPPEFEVGAYLLDQEPDKLSSAQRQVGRRIAGLLGELIYDELRDRDFRGAAAQLGCLHEYDAITGQQAAA